MPATTQGIAETLLAPTGRRVIETIAGIPNISLINLFRFTETSIASPPLEDVTGARVATSGPDGGNNFSTIGSGGGGLLLSGVKRLVLPTVVDVTRQFTILIAATMAQPLAGQRGRQIMQMGNFPERGWSMWAQIYADASPGDVYGIYAAQSRNGTASIDDFLLVRRPWVAQFGYSAVYVMRATGDGRVRVEERRFGQSSRLVASWDLTTIMGAAGNRQALMPIIIGSSNTSLADMPVTYDCVATYGVYLDEEAIRAWMLAVSGLTNSRGRQP